MNDPRKLIIKTSIGILIFILFYYMILVILGKYGFSSQDIKNLVEKSGPLGFVVLTFFMTIFIITPLPDTTVALVANVIYGPIFGFIIVITGAMLGMYLDFIFVRRFGRKLFQKKFPILNENINIISQKYGFISMVFLRVFPTVTFDIVSYLAALTRIRLGSFLLASFIGILPFALIYSIIGVGIESDDTKRITYSYLIGLSLLVFAIILSKYGKRLRLNKLERDDIDKTK